MFSRRWTLLMVVFALIFSLALTACGDDEDPEDTVEDTAGDVGDAADDTADDLGDAADDAADAVDDAADDASDALGDAADDAGDALGLVDGDPDAGATVYTEQGCTGCHSVDSDAAMTGPSLQNIGTVAEERTDQSAAEYIRESITHPDAYIVEGYQEGIMPAYDELPDDQLDNLVAYLLTLQ